MLKNLIKNSILLGLLVATPAPAAQKWQPIPATNPTPFSETSDKIKTLEQEFLKELHHSNLLIEDPIALNYIRGLGAKITKNIPNHAKIRYFIIKLPQINAFAAPGANITLNSGLVLETENESQLASVMAHEIAHVNQHHIERRLERDARMQKPMLATTLLSIALGVLNPGVAGGALMASLGGYSQMSINFTRSNELEADRMGMGYLVDAGFNPYEMANLFRKLKLYDRLYDSSEIPAILKTHPLDEQRITEAQNRAASYPKVKENVSIDYLLFRERVRVLTKVPRKLIDVYQLKLQKHPRSFAYNYGLAFALMRSDHFSKAQKIYQKLIKIHPYNTALQIDLTDNFLLSGQYKNALKSIHELYLNYPKTQFIILKYVEVLQANHKTREAIDVLQNSLSADPDDAAYWHALAKANAKIGQQAEAYFAQAQAYLLINQPKKAIEFLQRSLRFTPKKSVLRLKINAKLNELH